jgi:hypothetical protein
MSTAVVQLYRVFVCAALRLTPCCSIVATVLGGSVQFCMFDSKSLRLKPSQLPSITLPYPSCVCALSFHPQHSLLLWCIGTASHAGLVTCTRCSDGFVLSFVASPTPALAVPSASMACVSLDDLGCVVIACSNGALVKAKLSTPSADVNHCIDVAVLLPASAAATSAVIDAQTTGKKRNKQQQLRQQHQDGHVSLAAVEPCSVAVVWSCGTCPPPSAAVYDCSFGSCRCATQMLSGILESLTLTQGHHRPLFRRCKHAA